MSTPKCEYCGCEAEKCLARCVKTGLYFCNGKGDTSTSHIVHYMRSNGCSQFLPPESSEFYGIDLKCYVCDQTNVYNLGFAQAKDGRVFIVCRSPCFLSAQMIDYDIDPTKFQPIISDGQIFPQMVNIPTPQEYQKITMEKVQSVNRAIRERLGEQDQSRAREGELAHAKLRYESPDEFCDIMGAFITSEEQANQALERRNVYTVSNLQWTDQKATFRAPIALHRAVSLGSVLQFAQGGVTSDAVVVLKDRRGAKLGVKFQNRSLCDATGEFTVSVKFNDIPFARERQALKLFCDNSKKRGMHWLLRDVILGNFRVDDDFKRENSQSPCKICEPPREYFEPLNLSQIRAMEAALSRRFTMIQGPPGTGKTTVIAAIALSFVRARCGPILVCSQSNVAADFATKRIAQTGVKVCRVMASTKEQVASDIEEFTTKFLADRDGVKDETEIIRQHDVVCTTCVASGGSRVNYVKFPVVLFDESGQIVDPDLLIPMLHGAQRVVLVGDHKQLGPVILSKECEVARYDLPLMQRLIAIGIWPSVLQMQYRMHPALARFPSMEFYENLLKDGIGAQHRVWDLKYLKWPKPDIPMFFWNVRDSAEEYYENGISFVNRHEAGCIAVILDALWKSGVPASEIGIITPYAGQQAYLIDSLPSMCAIKNADDFFKDLEIASVDAFQGREKSFILLSNVRANQNCEIGFLRDQRRVCVSLTRAKYGMIIVGSADTFAKNQLWCKLIQHYQSLGVFVNGTLNDLTPSDFTPRLEEGDGHADDGIKV